LVKLKQAAGQAFGQQQSMASQQGQLAQSALGLGQAYSGLGQQQLGLGQAGQAFLGQDVGALSTLGAQNQALAQAQLSAQSTIGSTTNESTIYGYTGNWVQGSLD
jgi:hypothetical protein